MVKMIVKWLLYAAALVLVANLVSGITVSSFGSALLAAVVIGLLNLLVRPVLVVLTLPVTVITLGLFLAVYLFLLIGWVRVISHFVKQGPDEGAAKAADGSLAVAGAGEKGGEQ